MKRPTPITALFVDVGRVLLTDRRGHHGRKRAARTFKRQRAQMEEPHRLNFGIYEEGKLTLQEYLSRSRPRKDCPSDADSRQNETNSTKDILC